MNRPTVPKAVLVYTARNQTEMTDLAEAAGFEILETACQVLEYPSKKYYLGTGKIKEIQEILSSKPEIQTVIFDTDLSAMQTRNLEEAFEVSVADRTDIILQIFLQRASSAQSRLQVENAVLKRSKNRLTRKNINFSRQGGGMKNKGAGETQLELDRRNIEAQISANEKKLEKLKKQRSIQRNNRIHSALPQVSLAGYTNAGKSTILNGLLLLSKGKEGKSVLEKDQLFATLDPSVRLIERPLQRSFLLTDTVGFISDLPHDLIQGFQTTLEEIVLSDLILMVTDISNPDYEMQKETVLQTLSEIHGDKIERLLIRNKADLTGLQYPLLTQNSLQISAKQPESLELLCEAIENRLFGPVVRMQVFIPHSEGRIQAQLYEDTEILEKTLDEKGLKATVAISSHLQPAYNKYRIGTLFDLDSAENGPDCF